MPRASPERPLARSSSKTAMKTSPSSNALKRSASNKGMKRSASNTGMKRPSSALRVNNPQPMKRINSKEEILSSDDDNDNDDQVEVMLSGDFAEIKMPSPEKPRALSKRISMRLLTRDRFEQAMRDPDRLSRAIGIAKKQHCEEDLVLFAALILWESMSSASARVAEAEKILKKYIEVGSPQEVCLPSSLRGKLLERKAMSDTVFFAPLKQQMLSELRLMPHIAQALLGA